jgi:hypothetical protein
MMKVLHKVRVVSTRDLDSLTEIGRDDVDDIGNCAIFAIGDNMLAAEWLGPNRDRRWQGNYATRMISNWQLHLIA